MSTSIGKPVRRKEDRRLVTGRGRFIADLAADALSVGLVRSHVPHGRIRGIDVSRAAASDGVVAVFTGNDLTHRVKPMSHERMPHLNQAHWYPLATDRVRHVGEPLVAVIAHNRYLVEDACELVSVVYDELPVVLDPLEAAGHDSPLLYDEWGTNVLARIASSKSGDVGKALADADRVFKHTFTCHRYTGIPMETRGCVVSWDGQKLTLWSSTQWPFVVRTVLASCLGIPESQLRVIAPDVGGGFGIKQNVFREELLLCALAREFRRPLKWIEDRSEHLLASPHARDQVHMVEVGATEDGRIIALRDRFLADMGSGALFFGGFAPSLATAALMTSTYDIQQYAFDVSCVVTNKAPTGAYRGFGMPEYAFVMERTLDLVARELGLDPLDVRRRNMIRPDQLPYQTATGAVLDSGDYPAALERAVQLVDYEAFRVEQAHERSRGRYIGIGLASFVEGSGPILFPAAGLGGAAESVRTRVEPDGAITVFTGLASQGQSHETVMAQVVASVFDVSPDCITVVQGDTERAVYGLGTWGGRGAAVGAAAAAKSAEAVREKALLIAAALLGCPKDDLILAEGRFLSRANPERAVTLGDVARAAHLEHFKLPADVGHGLEAIGTFDPRNVSAFPDDQGMLNICVTYSNAAHVTVVEVDPELATTRILRYIVVEDCGRIINPTVVDGQIRGGVAQGIGGALLEEIQYDNGGQLQTRSLAEYLVPTAFEIPKIEIAHIESPATNVPGGFKGVGESGAVGPPAAIAGAIEDALSPFGVTITDTRLAPSRILEAIGERAISRTVTTANSEVEQ